MKCFVLITSEKWSNSYANFNKYFSGTDVDSVGYYDWYGITQPKLWWIANKLCMKIWLFSSVYDSPKNRPLRTIRSIVNYYLEMIILTLSFLEHMLLTRVSCYMHSMLLLGLCYAWEWRVYAAHAQLPSNSSLRCSHSDIWGGVGDSLCL